MAQKKVIVVVGSPRLGGNSDSLAQQITAGAQSAGARVEVFHLHEMNIQPCDACEVCQGSDDVDCKLPDDMQPLYPKLRKCDALVIASPIYWFTVSAQTKLFMDRWYALEGPSGNSLRGKKIAIALTYGDTDPFASGAVNALRTFQDAFKYIGADIVGTVYASASKAGEIRQNKAVMDKAHELGKELVA